MALFGKKKLNKDASETTTKTMVQKSVTKEESTSAKKPSMQDLYSGVDDKIKKGKEKGGLKVEEAWLQNVLIKPLVTEKATNLVEQNKYAFVVDRQANKITVARAINALYGVKALSVNIINRQGKRVTRGKIKGKRKNIKIALVTVAKGVKLKIYEGV